MASPMDVRCGVISALIHCGLLHTKGEPLMQPYYTTLFVPLDIGKNVHWCAGYEGYDLKPVVEPFKVRSDRSGFEQVTGVLAGLLGSGQ
jgi:hypothetical protein